MPMTGGRSDRSSLRTQTVPTRAYLSIKLTRRRRLTMLCGTHPGPADTGLGGRPFAQGVQNDAASFKEF